jgi:hypothetical protein
MLESFGLKYKILCVNADNAASNDTQTSTLGTLPNSFEMENRIRCFNHTIQLAAVALIKPFNAGMMKTKGDSEKDDDEDGGVADAEEENEEEGVDDDDDNSDDSDDEDDNTTDDTTDDINEFQMLTEAQQDTLVKDTALVRATVTKVCICCYTISSSNIYYRFDNCPLPSSIQP